MDTKNSTTLYRLVDVSRRGNPHRYAIVSADGSRFTTISGLEPAATVRDALNSHTAQSARIAELEAALKITEELRADGIHDLRRQDSRIAELEGALRKVSDRLECAVSDAPAHVRAMWQTDVDAARALLGGGK